MFLLPGLGALVQRYQIQQRLKLLRQLIQELVGGNCSILVERRSAERTASSSLLSDVHPSVVAREENIVLSTISPKVCVSLKPWVRYDPRHDRGEEGHDVFVVLELDTPISTAPYIQSKEGTYHHIAWKSGTSASIAVGCSVTSFLTLCDSLIRSSLSVGGANVDRLFTVSTKMSSQSSARLLSNIPMKPPNILVYCGRMDSQRQFQGAVAAVMACLPTDGYTVYPLKHEHVHTTPWQDNSQLLIVNSDNLIEETDKVFAKYVKNGGHVLSFGSSLDTHFLQRRETNTSAKLAKFDIKFEDSEQSLWCLQGRYVYETSQGGVNKGQDEGHGQNAVMATDQSNGDPVVVGVESGDGKAIFSQLLLHRDPTECSNDQETFNLLKQSNSVRCDGLRHLLSWLGITCSQPEQISLTPAWLLTQSQDIKTKFLSSIQGRLKNGCLASSSLKMEFTESWTSDVTAGHLPVIVSSPPQNFTYFRPAEYWHHLLSKELGQVVLYADVIPTTMVMFESLQFAVPGNIGVVAIPGRQTAGKGRGGNSWLSPAGCAMFSLLLRVPLDSNLGQKISFLQHIASLAVVHSVTTMDDYQNIDVRLKWPNDIYYSDQMKLGGVLVTSTIMGSTIYAVIGCGFNVSNSNPTICINDIIHQYNTVQGTQLQPCSKEQLVARAISHMEKLVTEFQTSGNEQFCQQYYKAWLHGGRTVRLTTDGRNEDVLIQGLDEYGFLKVQTHSGEVLSVQPDGNSFDMMHNLILMKKH